MEIKRVHGNQLLGVITNDRISWKSHIKHVQNRLSGSVSLLNKAKQVLDQKSPHILYCLFVLTYLSYCVESSGNEYKRPLQPLFILQKRAIRIIYNVGYLDSLLLHSELLEFTDRVEFQTVQIMFKAKKINFQETST